MLSQDDYKLYTNQPANYSQEDWEKLVAIAAARLASFLCLDKLGPDQEDRLTAEEYDALKLLAAIYDSMRISAYQYDNYGKTILIGNNPTVLPPNLAMLLANFLCLMLAQRGNPERITSKRVRNYQISFSSEEATSAFTALSKEYGDIIAYYSACGSGVCCESSPRGCCYGCF